MKNLLKRIALILAVCAFAGLLALGYAYFIEPNRLIIERTEIRIPHWDKKLDGFKVVAISDIHGGSNGVTERRLLELVELSNLEKPDMIVLLGDFVSEEKRRGKHLRMPVETIAKKISAFRARYGVYAVIGNHDWWYDEKAVTAALAKNGIEVLENSVRQIVVGDKIISLWGIEDNWKGRDVPTEDTYDKIALKENIVAITHNPDSLLKTPTGISVMFAGHSHGGQVKFPIYGAYPFVNDGRFMKGEAVVDGKHVYVTTGIGVSGPQIRFGVPPEISVVKLYSE